MRRFALLTSLLLVPLALAGAGQGARGQTVERIGITDAARQAHPLPAGLLVELESPTGYERQSASGDAGRWVGGRYEQIGHPENVGRATLDWTVSFDQSTGEADAIAHAHIQHTSWARDQRGGLSVPHVVGTRAVGTILGYYEMVTPSTPGDARFEGVLAFPLDTNLHAVIRFEALDPPDDSYMVNGSSAASSWNRGQLLVALAGAQLQGNLPPKIVAARAIQRGRMVRGKGGRPVPGLGARCSRFAREEHRRDLDEGLRRQDRPARLLRAQGEEAREIPRERALGRVLSHEPRAPRGPLDVS